jgi:acetoin utilization deacetylase AcuC-like enzyme
MCQCGLSDYQTAFDALVVPFVSSLQPDLLIVSAGYDANEADPLAEIALQPEDFGILAHYCLPLARRIMFGLEGGYNLESLSQSVIATLSACLGAENGKCE